MMADGGDNARHIPVLCGDVVRVLNPQADQTFLDGTFGAGGYARAVLEAAPCRLIGIDRDPNVIRDAQGFCAHYEDRVFLAHNRFSQMQDVIAQARAGGFMGAHSGIDRIDGIMLDIGVSSMQLDEAGRGFSFMSDGPLDMRMSQDGPSAADAVNLLDEELIAEILWLYGDERRSRAIAKAIVAARAETPFETTGQLADLIANVLGRRPKDKKHPATRSFQALRIFINNELEELVLALIAAEKVLIEGGILAIVTFHSLEDRIVKRFFAQRMGRVGQPSRHQPALEQAGPEPSFKWLGKDIAASKQELAQNPRARSARLRFGARTGAEPWPEDLAYKSLPQLRKGDLGSLKALL